jgi:hypothetical protein
MFDILNKINLDTYSEELITFHDLTSVSFNPNDFETDCSEESILITKAPKNRNDDKSQFILASIFLENWSDRIEYLKPFAQSLTYKNINEHEFYNEVKNLSHSLKGQLELPFSTNVFINAIIFSCPDDSLYSALFADYEKEFIFFSWETTA